MLCKFYLHIGSAKFDLASAIDVTECVKNWEDIKISYTRKDLGGVVRKVSSDIEFIDSAREAILEEFEGHYLSAKASFAIYTIDNEWNYNLKWSCPLDFASMEDSDGILSISSIDNSAEALIKANKSTKYDYEIEGGNVCVDAVETVRRVRIKPTDFVQATGPNVWESRTMNSMQTQSGERFASCYFSGTAILVNEDGQEISSEGDDYIEVKAREYSDMIYVDDQLSRDWWLIRCKKECDVYLSLGNIQAEVEILHASAPSSTWVKAITGEREDGEKFTSMFRIFDGEWRTRTSEKTRCINNAVFKIQGRNGASEVIHMRPGDKFGIAFQVSIEEDYDEEVAFRFRYRYTKEDAEVCEGNATYTYTSGGAVYVPSKSLDDALQLLLASIGGTDSLANVGIYSNIVGRIDDNDSTARLTRLIAASYIKDSAIKKMQLSFDYFAEMMEACFGYVYSIENVRENATRWRYVEVGGVGPMKCLVTDGILENTYSLTSQRNITRHEQQDNYLPWFSNESFEVHCNVYLDLKKMYVWSDNAKFDDKTGFYINLIQEFAIKPSYYIFADGQLYRLIQEINPEQGVRLRVEIITDFKFVSAPEEAQYMMEYERVTFAHRTKMFDPSAVKKLSSVNNFSQKIAEDVIYSEVNVGYQKKDYDSSDLEGKEFNGEATYSTGMTLGSNQLSLICPMRADCMGIEQALRKRSEQSKDDKKEDNDVFVVVCSPTDSGYIIKPNYSIVSQTGAKIVGQIRNDLLHPYRMIEANKALIGISTLALQRTAFDGNSDVRISNDEESGTYIDWEDIPLDERLARAVRYTIETNDIEEPAAYNGLIEFEWHGKTLYGFILDVDYRLAREESATYTLLAYDKD